MGKIDFKLFAFCLVFLTSLVIMQFENADAQESEDIWVHLDKQVYTWTDKVYITVSAPSYNTNPVQIDEIGNSNDGMINISVRGFTLSNYMLSETGPDTGKFTGEITLTGFLLDADGNPTTGDENGNDVTGLGPSGKGPTDGLLPTDDDDGITVSFEFSEDETVVGSALIRWNIGEVQWLEASYLATGTGVVSVVDPDMNLNPEAVDNFDVYVWSDSDAGGIDLTVTETNEATGIFQGTVFFTVSDESSGHRLRVAEGDTITAEYEDNTLPDPYTTADELDITGTSIIGTTVRTYVPPLKQTQLGIAPSDVECKSGMELILKYSGEPACVKPGTKQKLIERGWIRS